MGSQKLDQVDPETYRYEPAIALFADDDGPGDLSTPAPAGFLAIETWRAPDNRTRAPIKKGGRPVGKQLRVAMVGKWKRIWQESIAALFLNLLESEPGGRISATIPEWLIVFSA